VIDLKKELNKRVKLILLDNADHTALPEQKDKISKVIIKFIQ